MPELPFQSEETQIETVSPAVIQAEGVEIEWPIVALAILFRIAPA